MHPQSELENYKLQVELLQEKLHRSEDNRQELEGKLEQIMKKRNEHERTLRSRSQRKYQQFLDEQKKRNERNRKLVEMLEHIDQQAAALSARSERLKMMKLQYELYFSKLVQSYSMKTLQSIPTVPMLPIQRPPNTYPTIKSDDVVPAEGYQAVFNTNTPQYQTVPIPMVVPIPNGQNRFHRGWAFATAPQGVLITLANNSTLPPTDTGDNRKNESNYSFDYSQFPIGYLPTTPTGITPMQCNMAESVTQQSQQMPSTERHSKPLFTPDDDIQQSRPHFEFRDQTPPSFSFADIKRNETNPNRMHPTESSQQIFASSSSKPKINDDLEINENKGNGPHEPEHYMKFREPEMFRNDSSVPRQSLKVDKLPNINPNNSFQPATQDGRIVHRGNKPNAIDFRTDSNEYIKHIKEMKETYGKNIPIPVPIPINVTSQEQEQEQQQEHSIDNITTTLQIQKIDETNVRDDEKINDAEDNEGNTSSAFPPLGGKCSIESIGDEALTKKPLENKTEQNTSNTAARNIDPSRDTEQITLFNGTKNSKDESTGASNRTTAIIDGGGETVENTRLETSYRPMHFDKKEKMSIENIETAIYGELLTKPENLSSTGLLDQSRGIVGGEEIEQNSQETEQYEYESSSGKDLYEQEQDPVMGEEQQVVSYPANNEQSDVKNENDIQTNQEPYNYTDNSAPTGAQQEYYNYTDPSQEYKDVNQEEVPQQEYTFTVDGQQPQAENYATDYQNYDPSQYQGEYDPNAYQYDYEQQPYDDPNQAQYAPEMYNQEYQQDPYSGEYANYEQNTSNEIDTTNQAYTDEQYTPVDQEVPGEQIEKVTSSEQEIIDTEADVPIPKENSSNMDEPNEQIPTQKVATPTSILSTEKPTDLASKKKKRVNFVDSETDESSTQPKPEAVSSESDFDFSASQ